MDKLVGGGGVRVFAEQGWGLGIGKKKVSDFVLIYRPIVYSLLVGIVQGKKIYTLLGDELGTHLKY
jgi:hypothetical protein